MISEKERTIALEIGKEGLKMGAQALTGYLLRSAGIFLLCVGLFLLICHFVGLIK